MRTCALPESMSMVPRSFSTSSTAAGSSFEKSTSSPCSRSFAPELIAGQARNHRAEPHPAPDHRDRDANVDILFAAPFVCRL